MAPAVVVVPLELNPVESTPVVPDCTAVTVITVELAVEVFKPDAVSFAIIVAVAPTVAPAATVTSPAALTEATPGVIDVKLSPEAANAAVELSL